MSEEKQELTVREAGQRGGAKRLAQIGSEGFAQMGYKGGAATRARYGKDHYARIARAGGAAMAAKHAKAREERGG